MYFPKGSWKHSFAKRLNSSYKMSGSLPVLNGVVTPINSLGWDYPTERGPFYLIYNWWRSPSFTVFIRIPLVPRFVQGCLTQLCGGKSHSQFQFFFRMWILLKSDWIWTWKSEKSGVLWKKVVPCQSEKHNPRDFFLIFVGNTPPELWFLNTRQTKRRKQTLDQFLLDGGRVGPSRG